MFNPLAFVFASLAAFLVSICGYKISATGLTTYPDITVVCGAWQKDETATDTFTLTEGEPGQTLRLPFLGVDLDITALSFDPLPPP